MTFKIIVIPSMVVFGGVLFTGGFHDGFFDVMWRTFPEYMMFFSFMGILITIAVMVARFFWRFQAVEKSVVHLDKKMDERFQTVDKRFEEFDKRLDKMEVRFDRLEDKVTRIMELLIERKG